MKAPGETQLSVNLRWRDLDPLGHVNYASYLTLLEDARDRWLVQRLGISGGHEYVVAHATIDFRSGLQLSDGPASVQIGVISAGTTSVNLAEAVFANDGRLAAEAKVMIVMWDSVGQCKRSLTDGERAALAADGSTSLSGKGS